MIVGVVGGRDDFGGHEGTEPELSSCGERERGGIASEVLHVASEGQGAGLNEKARRAGAIGQRGLCWVIPQDSIILNH